MKSQQKDKTEYRTLKLTMERDKYDIIASALENISQEYGVETARALELLCADYLAGINVLPSEAIQSSHSR